MVGQPESGIGVVFTNNAKGSRVRDGTIRLWEGGGVHVGASGVVVEGITVRGAG